MLSQLFAGTTIPALEQVVNFSQARHAVLAGNIANFDTPGYRVRDLSPERFQTRLAAALKQRDAEGPVSPGDLAAFPNRRLEHVSEDMEGLLFHDNSNGALEQQVAALAKNQQQHNLAIAVMTNQFRLLQTAISERV